MSYLEFKKDPDEVGAMQERAKTAVDVFRAFPEGSYQQGVADALGWVLGELDEEDILAGLDNT